MRYAAIDIGSNAIRLFIADIHELNGRVTFKRNTMVRVPIRLGADVFLRGEISPSKSKDLIKAMVAFRNLMDVYKVSDYLAYATSAMRESKNGIELVKQIHELGIEINVVDGEEEANVIYSNKFEKKYLETETLLYIDVGGGSTEVTIVHKGLRIKSRSFSIGTIRLLNDSVSEKVWISMKDWIIRNTHQYSTIVGVGTGGNIARISTLANQKTFKPLSLKKLRSVYDQLCSYSLKERIVILGLRPDRADVIIPACEIFLNIMKWGKIKHIEVPQMGVVDGIIQTLIEKNYKK